MKRGPQSAQSVPYAQLVPMAPSSWRFSASSPPSWQYELFPYGPPRPRAWMGLEMGLGVGSETGWG